MKTVPINPPGLPPLTGILSHGVSLPEIGLVYTSGQVAWGPDGAVVGGDLATQFVQVYENVDRVLAAANTSRDQIIKETVYLVGYTTDRAEEFVGLLAAARGDSPEPPASTTVGVETLYAGEFLVEIDVVAVI